MSSSVPSHLGESQSAWIFKSTSEDPILYIWKLFLCKHIGGRFFLFTLLQGQWFFSLLMSVVNCQGIFNIHMGSQSYLPLSKMARHSIYCPWIRGEGGIIFFQFVISLFISFKWTFHFFILFNWTFTGNLISYYLFHFLFFFFFCENAQSMLWNESDLLSSEVDTISTDSLQPHSTVRIRIW